MSTVPCIETFHCLFIRYNLYDICIIRLYSGLADEVKHLFRVAWRDSTDLDKGFKYLYLTPEHFRKVSSSVKAELIEDEGESRYKITDIIGIYLQGHMT